MPNTDLQNFRHGYPDKTIHISLWLYFPVTLIVTQVLAANFLNYETYFRLFDTEFGLIENLTVIMAFISLIIGCMIWPLRSNFPLSIYSIYILLIILGCIYIIGEELSWGQHYMGWKTPEWLAGVNQQKETNIHNIHNAFGVAPKIVMEWSIYIGGIFLILFLRFKNSAFNQDKDWQFWIFPTFIILPASVMAFIFRIIDRIENWNDLDFVIDWDETHECLLLYVVFLYMLSIYIRLRQVKKINQT